MTPGRGAAAGWPEAAGSWHRSDRSAGGGVVSRWVACEGIDLGAPWVGADGGWGPAIGRPEPAGRTALEKRAATRQVRKRTQKPGFSFRETGAV